MTDNAIEPIAIHCPICGYHQVVPLAEWLFQSSDLGHGHTCGSGKCPSHTKMVACVKYQYNPCASRGEIIKAIKHWQRKHCYWFDLRKGDGEKRYHFDPVAFSEFLDRLSTGEME